MRQAGQAVAGARFDLIGERCQSRGPDLLASVPQIILCLYDLHRFGGVILMDVLRTHPMVIV
jgi:hypothetical protein